MRRMLGLMIMLVLLLPFYNVGLPTLAIPLSNGLTAYAHGRGDSCADSIGLPPLLGFYGSCLGDAVRGLVTVTPVPGDSENRALEEAYSRAGHRTSIDGPSYGAGEDFRAGKKLAAGEHPTPVVVSFGPAGSRVVERPTGGLLILGLVVAALFLTGVGMLVWPKRY
jgi:hypothetical protein